ncbi:hypothetical protein M8Z33_12470 [Streptomyces sp. ZAF1911]|uniref:hypothetical protein n=1 Tax=Streptomyces sp. ZAF1911 TaxID=2944129 RepID=UPI00237B274C|nr:hypothetical protein [Streptomyces sp. ZAF1911]MDD9377456.1 hypothetical protein [Streptomyces sp. ZAF1911]
MLIPSARTPDCAACGGPHATWVVSLVMILCRACARASTHHPEREPVLVGQVLAEAADAADALAHTARTARTTTPAHPYSAVLLALWRARAQRGT